MLNNKKVMNDYIIALTAALIYGLIAPGPFYGGVFAALLIGLIISGIIIIFVRNRKKRWSKVFMWSTITISVVAGLGHILF